MPDNQDRDLEKLREAITWSRKELYPFRRQRLMALRQYVGDHYSGPKKGIKTAIAALALAVDTYTYLLVPHRPRVLVTTTQKALKPYAPVFEMAVNWDIDRIDLETTLRRMVKDAIFCLGIVKMGIGEDNEAFVGGVDFDDWVQDMTPKDSRNALYCGNRYRMLLDEAKEREDFEKDVREDLVATPDRLTDEGDVGGGGEDAKSISRMRTTGQDTEYKPQVELWDQWLADEQVLITFPADGSLGVLKRTELKDLDPAIGPYPRLDFTDVPGNAMALPPVAHWRNMAELLNHIMLKVGRQAIRQKTIPTFSGGSTEDAKRLKDARDGVFTRVDSDLRNIVEVKMGGAPPESIALVPQTQTLFSWVTGNIESLAGLGPQSETVGQDKMIAQSAGVRPRDMGSRVLRVTKHVGKELGRYRWEHPAKTLRMMMRIRGTDIKIPVKFGRSNRKGKFNEYDFDVVPFSGRDQTPDTRAAKLRRIWREDVMPFMPILAPMGIKPNMQGFLKKLAKYEDLEDDLMDIVEYGAPMDGEGQRKEATKPADTKREYVRTNRGGATREGSGQNLAAALLGQKKQGAEQASIGRAVS